MKHRNVAAAVIGVAGLLGVPASAQMSLTAPLVQHEVPVLVDSGLVSNRTGVEKVVFSDVVSVPNASWLRLTFDEAHLANGAYLRMTSIVDGGVQIQRAEHLRQWNNTSAYFNGDMVLVEIVAPPHSGASRLLMTTATAGDPATPESICGPTDDRVLSTDARNARLVPIGCTIWIFDDPNRTFLTAGHCISNGTSNAVAEFNVPLSSPGGSIVHPPPEHQYAIDSVSIQSNGGQGQGNDWAYCGAFPNTNTGKTPFEAQGDYYETENAPAVSGQQIRITGYGVVSSPVSPTWSQVQKTHVGPYWSISGNWLQYQTDTTGGNSGSPVINETTGASIGIHTHGGCSASAGNSGTAYQIAGLQNALANPKGVCIPQGLKFEYPGGLPTVLQPGGGTSFDVKVLANAGNTPLSGTAMLHYSTGGAYTAVSLVETGPNEYTATFPDIACPNNVTFYLSSGSTGGKTFTDPISAPSANYPAKVGILETIIDENFETDAGFTVTNDPSLTDGGWDRGIPVGGGDREDPPTDFDGSGACWLTDNVDGNSDVDGGPTIITSPVYDLAGTSNLTVSFARWHGSNTGEDQFRTEVSNNGGTSWVLVSSVAPDDKWTVVSFTLDNFVTPTSQVRIRVSSNDPTNNSITESGFDRFRIEGLICESACYADCEDDGDLDVFDFLCFQGELANQTPYADCEEDGDWDIFDFLCFQGKYAQGC